MRIPSAAIEAGAKALENEHRIGSLEKSLSVLEAAMPHFQGEAHEVLPAECANGQANTCRHDSASGMDDSFGPGKVWRCDHCGLCWIEGYSPHDDRAGDSA